MTRTALLICIGSCTVLLSGAFGVTQQWVFVPISLAIGIAWFWLEWRGQGQVADLGMVSVTTLSAVQVIRGSVPWLMVVVMVLALSAWDLSCFRQRLMDAGQDDMRRSIEKRHLRRLLMVNIIGLALAELAISIQLRISFYALLFIGGVALLAIYWGLGLIARLSREVD